MKPLSGVKITIGFGEIYWLRFGWFRLEYLRGKFPPGSSTMKFQRWCSMTLSITLFCWLCYFHRLWLHHTMNALFLSGCGFVIWDKFLLMWNFRDESQLWNHKSVLFSAKKTATITQPLFSIGQVSHRNLDFSSTVGFCIHFWQHHCY